MTKQEIIEARSRMVAIGNELIQKSRYTLTLTEQRILLFIVSKIKPNDKPGTEYKFTTKEFKEVCGLSKGGETAANIENALDELKKRVVKIPIDAHKRVITGWFNDAVLDDEEKSYTFTFSKYMTPYLFNLRYLYTQFCLENVLSMKSTYGIRLYEYLASIKNLKYKEPISIDDLKHIVGIEDNKYPMYKDLRVRVIEPAIRDINTFSDIEVSYEEIKRGRKVEGIDFKIKMVYWG